GGQGGPRPGAGRHEGGRQQRRCGVGRRWRGQGDRRRQADRQQAVTDESKLARDAERGRIARDILQSDVFTDAVGKVEAELIEEWKATPALAPEARERLW